MRAEDHWNAAERAFKTAADSNISRITGSLDQGSKITGTQLKEPSKQLPTVIFQGLKEYQLRFNSNRTLTQRRRASKSDQRGDDLSLGRIELRFDKSRVANLLRTKSYWGLPSTENKTMRAARAFFSVGDQIF